MSFDKSARPTRPDLGAEVRRPGLLTWVFRRELALAHRSYWRCDGPVSTLLAVLFYPLWLTVALPLALLLGLLKVAVLGAMLAAVSAAAWNAYRTLAVEPARGRRRSQLGG